MLWSTLLCNTAYSRALSACAWLMSASSDFRVMLNWWLL